MPGRRWLLRETEEPLRPGPVTGAVAAHRALTADPSLKTDWGGHKKFGAWIAQIGQGVPYSSTPSPGWMWDAKRFSPELSALAPEGRPAIEEQVTRVTEVPALSSDQFRQVFLALESKLRENLSNRSELARSVRDDCVAVSWVRGVGGWKPDRLLPLPRA